MAGTVRAAHGSRLSEVLAFTVLAFLPDIELRHRPVVAHHASVTFRHLPGDVSVLSAEGYGLQGGIALDNRLVLGIAQALEPHLFGFYHRGIG